MPITLCVQPYCDDCGEFEPFVERICIQRNKQEMYRTAIICKHETKCKKIYEIMKARGNLYGKIQKEAHG